MCHTQPIVYNSKKYLHLGIFLPLQINAYTHVDHGCEILALSI